jgi:aminopeptidase N
MLRKEIGDSLFFSSVQKYYQTFEYSNASTKDLKQIFERVSKKNLNDFFEQWVYKGTGHIELKINWTQKIISNKNTLLEINIKQNQNGYKIYHFPLDIEVIDSTGKISELTPYISSDTTLTYKFKNKLESITFDKNNWLLAEIKD